MTDAKSDERAATEFERLRPYPLRVAYSHLGSLGEAEDVVQEAWLRLVRAELSEIREETGGFPTVVAFTLDRGRISSIDLVRNPEKLRTLTGTPTSRRQSPDPR